MDEIEQAFMEFVDMYGRAWAPKEPPLAVTTEQVPVQGPRQTAARTELLKARRRSGMQAAASAARP